MFAGHAAIAMFAKSARRRVPALLLLVAAFGPDLVEFAMDSIHRHNKALSHSLVSVALVATVLSLGYWIVSRAKSADVLAVWCVYVLHWPADYFTGIKPTWPGGPTVGRMLYMFPAKDAVIEIDLILVCWVVYWYSLSPAMRSRKLVLSIPWVLIALQIGFDFGLSHGFPGA